MLKEMEETLSIAQFHLSEPEKSRENGPWGWHLALDLHDCEPGAIRSAETIRAYVIELCELIQMKRFGDAIIVNFGEEERVAGYSLVQLIETSNICGHFANGSNAAYIDIFSCKQFDPQLAASFTIRTFGAERYSAVFLTRD